MPQYLEQAVGEEAHPECLQGSIAEQKTVHRNIVAASSGQVREPGVSRCHRRRNTVVENTYAENT
jgi:hypothetical protein